MALFSTRSLDEWVAEYALAHQHPTNRLLHTIGIPMIALSLMILPLAFVKPFILWISLELFVLGWVLQFIGHAYEGKPPEFFKDWRFLLIGLRWWFAKMQGKV